MDRYGRKYLLSIGQPILTKRPPKEDLSPWAVETRRRADKYEATFQTNPQVQAVALDREYLEVSDLQIKATLHTAKDERTDELEVSTIDIYNLSREKIDKIYAGLNVYLEAGYEQDTKLPLLYAGTILR